MRINSLCRAPYLRNHISYDFHFMVLLFKMIIPSGDFFIFLKFSFSGLLGGNMVNVQNDKKILSVVLNISGIMHHMIIICGTKVQNDNISKRFIIFSKFWFFGCLGESKGKNNRKRLLHFKSQEPYIIRSWFMVHMCKRIISPGVFCSFSNF